MTSCWYFTALMAALMIAASTLAYLNLIPGGWIGGNPEETGYPQIPATRQKG